MSAAKFGPAVAIGVRISVTLNPPLFGAITGTVVSLEHERAGVTCMGLDAGDDFILYVAAREVQNIAVLGASYATPTMNDSQPPPLDPDPQISGYTR